ncbi:type II toxin-antitoxin system VapC family toxin [Synechococcus sp. FACHB-909]|nr:type II toxin-antitoxin system VapC family toxin [Synechococcus sp. FACHB-909]
MIYLDTCVVVALLNPEASSPRALEWLEQCRDTLISSDWLITETHSALGLKQRHHGLSPEARTAAGEHVERLLQDPALGLRAGDALHLAVALQSRCSQLASFNGLMRQAVAALGLAPVLDWRRTGTTCRPGGTGGRPQYAAATPLLPMSASSRRTPALSASWPGWMGRRP